MSGKGGKDEEKAGKGSRGRGIARSKKDKKQAKQEEEDKTRDSPPTQTPAPVATRVASKHKQKEDKTDVTKAGTRPPLKDAYKSGFYDSTATVMKRDPGKHSGQKGRKAAVAINYMAFNFGDVQDKIGRVIVHRVDFYKLYGRDRVPKLLCKPPQQTQTGARRQDNKQKDYGLDREESRKVFWEVAKQNNWYNLDPTWLIYDDGSLCYTPKTIIQPTEEPELFLGEVSCPSDGSTESFGVLFVRVGDLDMDPRNALPSLEGAKQKTPQMAGNIIQFLNSLLTAAHRCPYSNYQNWFPSGNAVYCVSSMKQQLQIPGKELWCGFRANVKPVGSNWTWVVNVDAAFGAFMRSVSMIEYVTEIIRNLERHSRSAPWEPGQMIPAEFVPYLRKELKKVVVYNKMEKVQNPADPNDWKYRELKIVDLHDKCASDTYFDKKTDGHGNQLPVPLRMNVAEYFAKYKLHTMQYPHMNLINGGRPGKSASYPMECLMIKVPQKAKAPQTMKDKEALTSAMIKHAAQKPEVKAKYIVDVTEAALQPNQFTERYGIKVDSRMMQPDARIIDPPKISYGLNMRKEVMDGQWKTMGVRFLKPEVVRAVNIVSFVPENWNPSIRQFYATLRNVCRKMGMQFPNEWRPDGWMQMDQYYTADEIRVHLQRYFMRIQEDSRKHNEMRNLGLKVEGGRNAIPPGTHTPLPLVIVVLPGRDTLRYGLTKYCSECENESMCMTQCIQIQTIKKMNENIAMNLAFKINVKMGGINHALLTPQSDIWERVTGSGSGSGDGSTLVLGLDVVHPTRENMTDADRNSFVSYAAIVGNVDDKMTTWLPTVKIQRPGNEHIVYLYDAVRERLRGMISGPQNCNKIIVFRDGISEGDFYEVLRNEMGSIKAACNYEGLNDVKITYIVARKRHPTRLIPLPGSRDNKTRSGNVIPGTVVDRDVGNPLMFDFYMVSQYGIQGTAVPTHYSVIYDNNDFIADEIQEMTHNMCHLFARCPRSVKVSAPAYYADLVCARAMEHHRACPWDVLEDWSSEATSSEDTLLCSGEKTPVEASTEQPAEASAVASVAASAVSPATTASDASSTTSSATAASDLQIGSSTLPKSARGRGIQKGPKAPKTPTPPEAGKEKTKGATPPQAEPKAPTPPQAAATPGPGAEGAQVQRGRTTGGRTIKSGDSGSSRSESRESPFDEGERKTPADASFAAPPTAATPGGVSMHSGVTVKTVKSSVSDTAQDRKHTEGIRVMEDINCVMYYI